MAETTYTVRIGSPNNISTNIIGTYRESVATRIYDVYLVGSSGAATRASFYDNTGVNISKEVFVLYTSSLTASNPTASSTNFVTFVEGMKFNNCCFVATSANFGYAVITIGTGYK